MPSFLVVTRSGAEIAVTAPARGSLMEAIRAAGVDELVAMCGGGMSCATCHVMIEAASGGAFAPAGEEELDLLEGSEFYEPRSRLSCQVAVDDALEGARVLIAPED